MRQGKRYAFKNGGEFIVYAAEGNLLKCQEVVNGVTVSKIFVMALYELKDKLRKNLLTEV